jgi:ribosomal protein L11 methyltransferase
LVQSSRNDLPYDEIQHILKNDFNGKSVLDMGCGTGVLAILAEMKGSQTF